MRTKELFEWAEEQNILGNSVYVYVEGFGSRLIRWDTLEIGENSAINMGGLNLSAFEEEAKEITLSEVSETSDLLSVVEEFDGISYIDTYKYFRIDCKTDSTFMVIAYYED